MSADNYKKDLRERERENPFLSLYAYYHLKIESGIVTVRSLFYKYKMWKK